MLLLEVKHEVLTQLQLLSGRWCLLCWLVIFCQVPKPQLFNSAIPFQCLSLCIKTSRNPLQTASLQRFKTLVLTRLWLLSGRRCQLHWLVIFAKFQSHHALILSISKHCCHCFCCRSCHPSILVAAAHHCFDLKWRMKFLPNSSCCLAEGACCAGWWFFVKFQSHNSLILLSPFGVCLSLHQDPLQTASTQRFKTVVLTWVQLLSGGRY